MRATFVARLLKPLLIRTVYRAGTVRTILFGPGRGLRYRIFPGFGLAALYGGWEPDEVRYIMRHCSPGAVAYDLGANFGHHDGAGHLAKAGAPGGAAIRVETVSLDSFVFEQGNAPPDFVKIDVEGAESSVLEGARRVLSTFRPVLLIELHSPEEDLRVGRLLTEFRYEARRTSDGSVVADLSKGWPNREGLWGKVVAYPLRP